MRNLTYQQVIAKVMGEGDLETMLDITRMALDYLDWRELVSSVTGLDDKDLDRLYSKVEACLGLMKNRPKVIGDASAYTLTIVEIACFYCGEIIYRGEARMERGDLVTCERCGHVSMVNHSLCTQGVPGSSTEVWID